MNKYLPLDLCIMYLQVDFDMVYNIFTKVKGVWYARRNSSAKMTAEQREEVQAHAEAHGESTNGFINRAISETMERDKAGGE